MTRNNPMSSLRDTGSQFAILFLILPAASLIWALKSEPTPPVNQLEYLKLAVVVATVSFALLWAASFSRTERNRTLFAVSAFLFLLWMFGTLLAIPKLNAFFDDSSEYEVRSRILSHRESRSSTGGRPPRSAPTCHVTLEKPLADTVNIQLPVQACETMIDKEDGVLLRMRQGAFGLAWRTDWSVIKNFDHYEKTLKP